MNILSTLRVQGFFCGGGGARIFYGDKMSTWVNTKVDYSDALIPFSLLVCSSIPFMCLKK